MPDFGLLGTLAPPAVLVLVIGYLLNSNRLDRREAREDRLSYDARLDQLADRNKGLRGELEACQANTADAERRAMAAEYELKYRPKGRGS